MAIIGLITARGGSKGIPGKNIIPLAGKPLLAYTAEAALSSKTVDRVILSTDDECIAETGRILGVEVPFMRPAALADDQAGSMPVIAHALNWLESTGESVEAIILLQPTSPLRTSEHIDQAVSLFRQSCADALVSVIEVPHCFHPRSLMIMQNGLLVPSEPGVEPVLRRQDLPVFYARNGPAILILSPDQVRQGSFYQGRTIPFLMSEHDSVDIDTIEDLAFAELLLSRRIRNLSAIA